MDEPILICKREYVDTPQLWVCIPCRVSTTSYVQPRCECGELMERAK